MRINIRRGGNEKQRFSILFFFSLPNNNIGGSLNQSVIKKALLVIKNVEMPFFKLKKLIMTLCLFSEC